MNKKKVEDAQRNEYEQPAGKERKNENEKEKKFFDEEGGSSGVCEHAEIR